MTHYNRQNLNIYQKKPQEIEQLLNHSKYQLNIDKSLFPENKETFKPYQALALYRLLKPYDYPDNRILEISDGYGYSTASIALAVPRAKITTLNTQTIKRVTAEWILYRKLNCSNVQFIKFDSWQYYDTEKNFDVVFVDSKDLKNSFTWWLNVNHGGMMLFKINKNNEKQINCFASNHNLLFDVIITDNRGNGIVGFYK